MEKDWGKMTRTEREEEWQTASGLPDDFDFYVSRSYFGYDPEYQSGKVLLLIWDGESPDAALTRPIAWALGQGWEAYGDGRYVRHPSKKYFVQTSIYGRLMDRVVKELGVSMSERGSAKDAKVWEGLGFHLVRETLEFKGAVERGILVDKGGKTDHLMPVAYLGERGVKEAVSVSSELEVELADMAKKMQRIPFQVAAAKDPKITENDALMADIMDSSDKGFWARHRG